MTRGKRRDTDQQMPNGSVVFWSRRQTKDNSYYVPVQCGKCGQERVINVGGVNRNFTGLCSDCASFARRVTTRTSPQVLSNGSIIYWNKERVQNGRRMVPIRCSGPFCGGRIRVVPVYTTYADSFTGQCRKCAHSYDRSGTWTGGRKRNRDGYILVKLPPNHPLHCMANSDGYVLEHRLVVAQKIGRPLRGDEIVHHINGKKDDNRLENLELLARRKYEHAGYKAYPDTPQSESFLTQLKRKLLE